MQPATHDPETHDPATHDPVTHDPVTHDPVTHDPVTHDPVTLTGLPLRSLLTFQRLPSNRSTSTPRKQQHQPDASGDRRRPGSLRMHRESRWSSPRRMADFPR
jgi:hypothetical protein